jgi:hypothetical protein
MTPDLWLIAVSGSAICLVVAYGLISSVCTRASVSPQALVLQTLLGRQVRLTWAEIRSPIRLWESFPFTRLEVAYKPPFFSVRSAYLVRLASLSNPESLLSAIREHFPVEPVLTTSDAVRTRPETAKLVGVLFLLLVVAIVVLLAITASGG